MVALVRVVEHDTISDEGGSGRFILSSLLLLFALLIGLLRWLAFLICLVCLSIFRIVFWLGDLFGAKRLTEATCPFSNEAENSSEDQYHGYYYDDSDHFTTVIVIFFFLNIRFGFLYNLKSLAIILIALFLRFAFTTTAWQFGLAVELQTLVARCQLSATIEHLNVGWEIAGFKRALRMDHIIEAKFAACRTLNFLIATGLAFGFILQNGALWVKSERASVNGPGVLVWRGIQLVPVMLQCYLMGDRRPQNGCHFESNYLARL